MKTYQLILFFLVCLNKSYCQKVTKSYCRIVVEIIKEKKSKKEIPIVQIKSTFPIEDSVWMKSLEKKVTQAIQNGKTVKKGKYIVSVRFILAKDGTISDAQCENNPGFGICEEVLHQVIKAPKWTPAQQTQELKEFRQN
jgi:hypothetical protein